MHGSSIHAAQHSEFRISFVMAGILLNAYRSAANQKIKPQKKEDCVMGRIRKFKKAAMGGILAAAISFFSVGSALSHCDTTGGPIIPEAKTALEKGDVTPILKWVRQENEEEIKAAFAKTVSVRFKGPEATALADQYFLETLVRLHRAGEGAPYTGIKDEPVEPIVAMAEKALAEGAVDEMIKKISDHMAAAIKQKFSRVVETKKDEDKGVAAGREFVEAYVTYMHYVEGIHAAIMSAGGHQHAGAVEGVSPAASAHEHGAHKK